MYKCLYGLWWRRRKACPLLQGWNLPIFVLGTFYKQTQSPQTVFVEVLFGDSLTGHRGWGQRTVLVCAGCPRSPSPSACPDAPENLHKDKSSWAKRNVPRPLPVPSIDLSIFKCFQAALKFRWTSRSNQVFFLFGFKLWNKSLTFQQNLSLLLSVFFFVFFASPSSSFQIRLEMQ